MHTLCVRECQEPDADEGGRCADGVACETL